MACRRRLEQIIGAAPDAQVLASRLIGEFGSLGAVLAASRARLTTVVNNDDEAVQRIRWFSSTMRYALRTKIASRVTIDGWRALLDYLRASLAWEGVERFHVLYLDVRNGLIVEDVAHGTIDAAPCYPREIVRRALEVGAASLILVHNHPSGTASASSSDIAVTRSIRDAAKVVGVALLDHLIIGSFGHVSLRAGGLM